MRRALLSLGTSVLLVLVAWSPACLGGSGLEDLLTDVSPGMAPTTMGGAFVAVADEISTVYWNPAGLANGGTSGLAVQATLAGQNLRKARDAGDQLDLIDPDDFNYDDARRLLDEMKGTYGVTVTPQFAVACHGWAASVTAIGLGRATLSEPAADQVRVQGAAAALGSGAISHGWKANEDLRLGASFRFIYGTAVVADYVGDATGVISETTRVEPSDQTITFDVGALYDANDSLTYGATLRNITSPDLFSGPAKTALATTLDVGAAYRKNGLTLAGDLHNLLGLHPRPDPSLHLGARYEFPKILSLQAGLFDGDVTFGAGLDLGPVYIAAGLGEDIERMITAGIQGQW